MYLATPVIIIVSSLLLCSLGLPVLDNRQGIYGFHYVTEFRHVGRDPRLFPRFPSVPHQEPVRYVYHTRENPIDCRSPKPLIEFLKNRGLKIFANLLQVSCLTKTLPEPGPYTLFVPTDEAFSRLPRDMYQRIISDDNYQRQFLKQHITRGRVTGPQRGERQKIISSLRDTAFTFEQLDNGQRRINNANVIMSDIEYGNGIIHIVDSVLLPPTSLDQPSSSYTHTHSREGSQCKASKTFLSFLKNRGLNIFANLLKTSCVSKSLPAQESITIFAPTDEAFSRLPPDMYQRLISDQNYQRQILQYHISRGRITSPQRGERQKIISSIRDAPLTFEQLDNGQHLVNNANVIMSDIEAGNRILHIIDSVLIPPPPLDQSSLLVTGMDDHSRVTLDDLAMRSTTTPI